MDEKKTLVTINVVRKQLQYCPLQPLTNNKRLESSFQLLSVLRGHSFFIYATTANDLQLWTISIPDFIHYILFVLS